MAILAADQHAHVTGTALQVPMQREALESANQHALPVPEDFSKRSND